MSMGDDLSKQYEKILKKYTICIESNLNDNDKYLWYILPAFSKQNIFGFDNSKLYNIMIEYSGYENTYIKCLEKAIVALEKIEETYGKGIE